MTSPAHRLESQFAMQNPEYVELTLHEARTKLNLDAHFAGQLYEMYFERGEKVRVYLDDAVIEGDLVLEDLLGDRVAGVWAAGSLLVEGDVLNWSIDEIGSFLAVGRDLLCGNLVAGCCDIRIRRDLRAKGVVVSTYNHGYMEIGRDVHARYMIVDDHWTIVRGDVHAKGFKDAANAEVDLPDSAWIDEIRTDLRPVYFDDRGFTRCPNGNVDLVKDLMAGRPILRI